MDKQNQKHIITYMYKNISDPFAFNFYDADSKQDKQTYKTTGKIMGKKFFFTRIAGRTKDKERRFGLLP